MHSSSEVVALHQKVQSAREKEANHLKAIQLCDELILVCQKEKDYVGAVDALQNRFLSYKHLYLNTTDITFALLARHDAEASLELAKKFNLSDTFVTCYFRVGEACMLFNYFDTAAAHFGKAVELQSDNTAIKGDYRYHYGHALYLSGNKEEGNEQMLTGLSEIEANPDSIDSFLINVWRSGCHLTLAALLQKEDPDRAHTHFGLARDIINSDTRLVIRKAQMEKLQGFFT